jgi:hypothetical protein
MRQSATDQGSATAAGPPAPLFFEQNPISPKQEVKK